MTEEPRPASDRGGPAGDSAGDSASNPWVHQDHPRIPDAPRTPDDPSYPSAPAEAYQLYRPGPGEQATEAPAPYQWPGPSAWPPPPDADPYGIRGQTIFDDLYRPEPSPASAVPPAPGPSAPGPHPSAAPVPPWTPGSAPTGTHVALPAPVGGAVATVEADPWRAWPMSAEERRWAPAAHWLPLLTTWVGPLVVLLTVGERNARVRECAKESLNFEVTFTLAMLVSVLLIFVGVGVLLVIVLPLIWIVLRAMAATRAARGEMPRYPLRIRFLS